MTDRFVQNVCARISSDRAGGWTPDPNWASTERPEVDQDMLDAFLLIGAQTTLADAQIRPIAVQWATVDTERKRTNTARIARELCKVEWSWPAFDQMVSLLLRDDLWPMPWHHYEKAIKAGASLEDAKAKIFIQTARTASVSIRLQKRGNFPIMSRLEGWHLYTDSEIGAHYANLFFDSVDPTKPTTWPPLYPGDLSALKTGSDGVYSRLGKFVGLAARGPFPAKPFG